MTLITPVLRPPRYGVTSKTWLVITVTLPAAGSRWWYRGGFAQHVTTQKTRDGHSGAERAQMIQRHLRLEAVKSPALPHLLNQARLPLPVQIGGIAALLKEKT